MISPCEIPEVAQSGRVGEVPEPCADTASRVTATGGVTA